MKRREWLKAMMAAGTAVALVDRAGAQNPTFVGPPGGTRGATLSVIFAGPFVTIGTPNGAKPLVPVAQFASCVRIQVNPGNAGKIAIGTSAMNVSVHASDCPLL